MGGIWEYTCTNCSHIVETSGDWEFYRDDLGQLKPYGHPVAASAEAKQHGVKGFTSNQYCPNCGVVHKVVVEEFKKPVLKDYWMASLCGEPADRYEPTCPECGGRLKEHLDENDICPKCHKGTFKQSKFIIS